MQNSNQSGFHVGLANKRFQQAIAQDALDRMTSSTTHRILNRDASRIYTAPPSPLVTGGTPKSTGNRSQAKHRERTNYGPVSKVGNSARLLNGPVGSPARSASQQRLYAQSLRIISGVPVRRPLPGAPPAGPWPPGSVFEYGSPANRQLSRQIEERLDAVAEWLQGPFTSEVRYSKEKEALVGMAKKDKKIGISEDDMRGYVDLNKELPDPFGERQVRGPETHPDRPSPQAKRPHGHVGPVHHIPVK